MPEDYLLQEFHEAGIWLPEELKAAEEREKAMTALGQMGLVPINPLSMPLFAGQVIPVRRGGFLGSVIGGIFGAL